MEPPTPNSPRLIVRRAGVRREHGLSRSATESWARATPLLPRARILARRSTTRRSGLGLRFGLPRRSTGGRARLYRPSRDRRPREDSKHGRSRPSPLSTSRFRPPRHRGPKLAARRMRRMAGHDVVPTVAAILARVAVRLREEPARRAHTAAGVLRNALWHRTLRTDTDTVRSHGTGICHAPPRALGCTTGARPEDRENRFAARRAPSLQRAYGVRAAARPPPTGRRSGAPRQARASACRLTCDAFDVAVLLGWSRIRHPKHVRRRHGTAGLGGRCRLRRRARDFDRDARRALSAPHRRAPRLPELGGGASRRSGEALRQARGDMHGAGWGARRYGRPDLYSARRQPRRTRRQPALPKRGAAASLGRALGCHRPAGRARVVPGSTTIARKVTCSRELRDPDGCCTRATALRRSCARACLAARRRGGGCTTTTATGPTILAAPRGRRLMRNRARHFRGPTDSQDSPPAAGGGCASWIPTRRLLDLLAASGTDFPPAQACGTPLPWRRFRLRRGRPHFANGTALGFRSIRQPVKGSAVQADSARKRAVHALAGDSRATATAGAGTASSLGSRDGRLLSVAQHETAAVESYRRRRVERRVSACTHIVATST